MVFTQTVDQVVISSVRKSHSDGRSDGASAGVVFTGQRHFSCKIGRNGIGQKQGEGDGITPIGRWKMGYFLYRADRIGKPQSFLSGFAIKPQDSWCDIPGSRRYNQPLGLTMANSSEALWRQDDLYNVIVVLDHNTCPFVAGKGSAIFVHISNSQTTYTQGCIALNQSDLLKLLVISGPQTEIIVRS